MLPNGDVLVAETNAPPKPDDGKGIKGWVMKLVMKRAGAGTPSANRITLLRDADGDGIAETRTVFLEGLHSPFGMALVGNDLYVANTDAIVRFPYVDGRDAHRRAPATKVADLPAGPINHHWTKNLIASRDGTQALRRPSARTATSARTAWPPRRAAPRSGRSTAQSGAQPHLRHRPAQPERHGLGAASGALWTVVNERDELGSDLVPDYLTSVRDGAFYGWPYSYYGQHVDERVQPQRPDLVAKAIAPDYALGPHTASLGLVVVGGRERCRRRSRNGMFIGQHGSWNRKPAQRLQGDLRAVRDGKPAGAAGRRADRLPQRRRQGQRPAGRRGDRQDAARCWSPTTSATSSGASPLPAVDKP